METNYSYETTTVETLLDDYHITPGTDDTPSRNVLQTSHAQTIISVIGYTVIFFLAIIGNSLVVVTLIQNKRMRSVTNVFLLSLSISDILFVVFCLPFTLVGQLLHNFIFGPVVCRCIPYMQGVTVTVSVWTMVAIALERYHAICNPLASRAWQTKTRAYKIIALIWVAALVVYFPAFYLTKLKLNDTSGTTVKCRTIYPKDGISRTGKDVHELIQFAFLLLIPFIILAWAYGLIVLELWRGMSYEKQAVKEEKEKNGTPLKDFTTTAANISIGADSNANDPMLKTQSHHIYRPEINKQSRSMNVVRSTSSNDAKKRVVRMLIVLVLLFFMAWIPTWIINVCQIINMDKAYQFFVIKHPLMLLSFRLISYSSACVNPIVYCFMNKKFRKGFMEAFSCCCCKQEWYPVAGYPTNMPTKIAGRQSTVVSGTHYTDVSTGDDD